MIQKQNGLESASTDQALTPEAELSAKEATSIMEQIITLQDQKTLVVVVPSSHAPSLELAGYSRLSGRELRRLAAKRLRKQARANK